MNHEAHMFNALALELYGKAYERHHGVPINPRDEYEYIVEPIAQGLAEAMNERERVLNAGGGA